MTGISVQGSIKPSVDAQVFCMHVIDVPAYVPCSRMGFCVPVRDVLGFSMPINAQRFCTFTRKKTYRNNVYL